VDPIRDIRERFHKYPAARFEEGIGYIRYLPDSSDGFSISFHINESEYVVSYDGWHEHFQDVESALNCFAFGLSDACRLKVVSRHGTPHKWIVESRANGDWALESETGLIFFPFWRRPKIEYRQNSLIKAYETGALS
jgi:hypothetical protein